jgi:hypothetical protein
LFRRRRLIQGSGDEGYRPEYIFGRSNSYIYQRLFGELHFTGFEVSHTKDGFRWEDEEEEFLELLKKELDAKPLPLLQQAKQYRALRKREEIMEEAEAAVERTAAVLEREAPAVLGELDGDVVPRAVPSSLSKKSTAAERVIEVDFRETTWRVRLELSDDPAMGPWVEVADRVAQVKSKDGAAREIGVRMSLVHPFTTRFTGSEGENIEPLLRIAAGLALAETMARAGGAKLAGAIRDNLNELLRGALSRA